MLKKNTFAFEQIWYPSIVLLCRHLLASESETLSWQNPGSAPQVVLLIATGVNGETEQWPNDPEISDPTQLRS